MNKNLQPEPVPSLVGAFNPQPSPKNLIIESQIFPPIQSIAYCMNFKKVLIEAKENYQKRSFRNRYHIGSHQGLLELSIPLLKGKNKQQPITEVKISYDSPWPSIHWKAIQSSYGKAAYFIYYKNLVEAVLFSECSHLFELNQQSLKMVEQILQQDWNIAYTKQFDIEYNVDTMDLRSKINLKNIGSLPMHEYYQAFSSSSGFIPNLSILDLIFHLGPDATSYLMNLVNGRTTDDNRQ